MLHAGCFFDVKNDPGDQNKTNIFEIPTGFNRKQILFLNIALKSAFSGPNQNPQKLKIPFLMQITMAGRNELHIAKKGFKIRF